MSTRMFILAVATAFLVQFAAAQLGRICHAPILNSRKDFDFNLYAGIWYRLEFAIFNQPASPAPYKCATMTFRVSQVGDEQVIKAEARYKLIDSGLWETDYGNITVPNPNFPGTWEARWELAGPQHPLQNVMLATDYNWAYNYACQMQEDGNSVEILNIWSRSPTLDPIVQGVLRDLMNGLGFSRAGNVIIDHSNCQ